MNTVCTKCEQVMYAEPMGSKTPTRSPQSALHLDPHAAPDEAEDVLHTPRHVPGTYLLHPPCFMWTSTASIPSLLTVSLF